MDRALNLNQVYGKDDCALTARVIDCFKKLAYLHKFYPAAVDQNGHELATQKVYGHGQFDSKIRCWIEQAAAEILAVAKAHGSISDAQAIEHLTKRITALKNKARDNELQHPFVKEFCILDDSSASCAACQYAAGCISRFTAEHSVYEYFIKSFDFKKIYCNSLFLAGIAPQLDEA